MHRNFGITTLASLVQLNPIYATFNVSEQDVLRIRAARKNLDTVTQTDFDKIPIEIALMNEDGFPHKGVIQYIAPELDPATGTILVRGVFQNSTRQLLPGLFVRIRVPISKGQQASLLVPNRAFGANQTGPYLLVVNAQDTVEQRPVGVGATVGELRVVESGLQPEDRVIVTGASRAVPGHRVQPHDTPIGDAVAASGPAPATAPAGAR